MVDLLDVFSNTDVLNEWIIYMNYFIIDASVDEPTAESNFLISEQQWFIHL